jgi:hypothetical protein
MKGIVLGIILLSRFHLLKRERIKQKIPVRQRKWKNSRENFLVHSKPNSR